MDRREFLQVLACAAASGLPLERALSAEKASEDFYAMPSSGELRLLHFTDCHAQLNPVYFREPSVNLGIGPFRGRAPHLVGEDLLRWAGIPRGGIEAHAFSYLDFAAAAERFGKVGGFAQLKTLVDRLRGEYGAERTLLLDGGDTWQGSGTALWTRGRDMVQACNLLGVDVMTGHWEFTYQAEEVLANIAAFEGDFVAQNVRVSEDALFEGAAAYDEDSGHAFAPYTIRALGKRRVAVIGQAFPYTPIANPSRFIPDWRFGIRDAELQELVDSIRSQEKPDAVVLLSHNGMDVDLKLASLVSGIDLILGGHTHDGMPRPICVSNAGGQTLVTNAGSNGKFLGVADFAFDSSGVAAIDYRLLPVFAGMLAPHAAMQEQIATIRAPYRERLEEELAVADSLLYRRGNFNGSFDQLICEAMLRQLDAQISLSPGFRWGTSVLPGQAITMEHVLDQTCITYPETYVREMRGEEIKLILEDVCDNLFNEDPFYQQGGDMVRVGGLQYRCTPAAAIGSRIDGLRLDDGTPIEASRAYKVAGWATVGSQSPGKPIWEIVAADLRQRKRVRIEAINTPALSGVAENPGIAAYTGVLG